MGCATRPDKSLAVTSRFSPPPYPYQPTITTSLQDDIFDLNMPKLGIRRSNNAHLSPEPHSYYQRGLSHIIIGSIAPVSGIFLSREIMILLLTGLTGVALILETMRFSHEPLNQALSQRLKPLLKETEHCRVTGATHMIIGSLSCFLLFDSAVAIVVLLFLSVGDPMAALIGRRAGGFRLSGKSPWGSIALFSSCTTLSIILWSVGVASPLWVLIVGAGVAALVELLPSYLDDNITIPVISGGVITLLAS